MSPDSEWYSTVDRMIAKLRGDPEADRPKVLAQPECKKARELFELGADPNEIGRLLVKAIQRCKSSVH